MGDFNESTTMPSNQNESSSVGIPCECADVVRGIPLVIVLAILLQVIGVVGNLMVFATTAYSRRIQLKMHQQAFVLSLATADTLFLTLVMPFVINGIVDGEWTLAPWTCQFQGYIVGVTCHASICSIAAIAVNRYYSIVHIAAYRKIFCRQNITAILASVWIYALILPVPSLLGWGHIKYHRQVDACLYDWTYSLSYTVTILTFGFLMPLAVIFGCYVGIWWAYRRSRSRIETQRAAIQISPPSSKTKTEECRLVGQLLALFLAFLFCWMPYLLLATVFDPYGRLDRGVYDVLANLMVLNAIIDPTFYFFFNRTLRTEAMVLMKRICCCQKQNMVIIHGTLQVQRGSETTT